MKKRGYILFLARLTIFLVLLILTPVAYFGVPRIAQFNEPSVWAIAEVNGEPWISITAGKVWGEVREGVYRLSDDTPIPVIEDVDVTSIAEVDGEGWIGTREGGFRGLGGEPIPFLAKKWVLRIESLVGDGWIGTTEGAYWVHDGETTPLFEGQTVFDFEEVGGEVWVGTDQGAYRMKQGEAIPMLEGDGVYTLAEVAGDAWIGTFSEEEHFLGDVLWMKDGELVPVMKRQLVDAVLSVREEAWIKTAGGLYHIEDEKPIRVHGLDAKTVTEAGGEVWLLTWESGLLKWENGKKIPVLAWPPAHELVEVGDQVLLGTKDGLFRIEDDQITPISFQKKRHRVIAWALRWTPMFLLITFVVRQLLRARIDRSPPERAGAWICM